MATSKERKDFINLIGTLAQKVCYERGYGNAQVWTCIAQACCESNYGKSSLMKNANAFFGVKASKKWKGKVYSTKTKECYDGVNYTTITDLFKAFDTPLESVENYFDLLAQAGCKHYNNSLKMTSVRECITEIKLGGYATAPNYIDTIVRFYQADKNEIEKYRVESIPAKSVDEIAQEVIDGLWGTGEARKTMLKNAGYDANTIQKRVNEMLK